MTSLSPFPALDEHRIHWRTLGDFEHFTYSVLAVDRDRGTTDFCVRYAPNAKIFLHRHRADTLTLVMSGEHRIYTPAGEVDDVRPAGTVAFTAADADAHSEGGGAHGAVVFYSTRGGVDGVLFDIMDEAQNVVGAFTIEDVFGLFDTQGGTAGA